MRLLCSTIYHLCYARMLQTMSDCALSVSLLCSCSKLINRPFPLRCNGMQYTWRHVWGASEGLLGRIFHCYIWEHSLRSEGCCFVYRGNTKLPWHPSTVPASTFSTVVDRTPSDFDTGQSSWLPPGTWGINIGEWSCGASWNIWNVHLYILLTSHYLA